MKTQMWPLDLVKPYDRNPRKNAAGVEAVARSIREFGFRQPIVVDSEGVILAGHTRYLAAQHLGLKTVPVHVAEELTAAQARAYRIADNRLNELSEWNKPLLAEELQALASTDMDLLLTGFTSTELDALIPGRAEVGEVVAPEPPDDPVTREGDLIVLGEHRLLCGDSAKPGDVDRLVGGGEVWLLNTDPPYNVNVEPRSNNAIASGATSYSRREDLQPVLSRSERGKKDRAALHHQQLDLSRHPGKAKGTTRKMRAKDRPLRNDFVTPEAFEAMLLAWFGNAARVLRPGGGFYIWGGYANAANYPPALKASGLYFSQAIIWDKQHPVLTRKDFMGAHEWCFYGWKEGGPHRFFGPANVPDLWAVKKVNPQSMVHLTEKPVELARRALEYSSKPGEIVLELFGGSGSTLIAAEQVGRRCCAMELDPAYCDVIVGRWEAATGKKADRPGRRKGGGKAGVTP